jgi:predicted DNA repair protein MutK
LSTRRHPSGTEMKVRSELVVRKELTELGSRSKLEQTAQHATKNPARGRPMQLIFLIAAVLTIILGLLVVGSVVLGLAFACIRRTRAIAPFVLFVPTLAALGAGVGSWGLAWLANEHYARAPSNFAGVLPFWAWIFGLLGGAVLGLVAGLVLAGVALLIGRNFRSTRTAAIHPSGDS